MKFASRHAALAALSAALLSSVGFSITPAAAQPAPSAEAKRDWPQVEPDRPWLYRGSDIPPDPAWVFGELPNGLRYAVRHNDVPSGQVSIRVAVDAGSINESDSERGYAHLLEHLVFRESKYLGNGEAIAKWRELGTTIGADTGAFTSPTQTVFNIDLPNVGPDKLSEAMKLLSGMVTAPVLTDGNVKTERPIVLAERRERGAAGRRVSEATQQTYFAGQRLATRLPIGTVKTLEAANAKKVQAFYDRWYRPDNTIIVLAGDFDTATLEQAVKTAFGGWTAKGEATPSPAFGDPVPGPDAKSAADALAPVGNVDVLVEPDLPRNIGYAVMRPWRKVVDTIEYNEGLLTDQLSLAIINRRLETRARRGGSFLAAQVGQEDLNRSTDATFVSITPLGADWKAALADTRSVIADALANPPTQAEIDREAAEFENAFRVGVETASVQQGSDLAENMVEAINIRETVASPEVVMKVFDGIKNELTPELILDHTKKLFSGDVVRGLMVVPDASEASDEAFRNALLAPVEADDSARSTGEVISFADLPSLGTPGTVTATAPTGLFDIELLRLSNGVTAMIWPSTAEPGRVSVRVRFGAGYGAFGKDDAAEIALGEAALMGTGMGDLDQDKLDRISTGRKMGLGFNIDDADFIFSAETRAADLEDQLYLFASKLSMPRWDAAPLERAKAGLSLGYDSYAASPSGIVQRDLEYLLRGEDPRFKTPTPAELDAVSMADFKSVWAPVLASGPIQVEIFGDFDRAKAIAAMEKTFGALAPRDPAAAKPDLEGPLVEGAEPVVIRHRGDADEAAAMIAWETGGGRDAITESRQAEILTQIFSNRLFDAMREQLGASYSPNVASRWPLDRADGGTIVAMAQIEPDEMGEFFNVAQSIATDLATNPPSADEIQRVTEPLKQYLERVSSGNGFWLGELGGASRDPRRIDQIRSILRDYSQTTPEKMQALAQKYLTGEALKVEILPEGAPVD
ncbi:M16 family metallopeptidase [Croceicoccus mobilis]|uniref:Peptidase M16 n=1 Tax=Croceicoccus mobilis TaxID=1703339 RepID=A0A917DND3_9SPHN|nr:M16 family metallopeptidase [Croceicoccus mobilis]GGD55575.1 peptidase M16 [Croceicoccus mobilis]